MLIFQYKSSFLLLFDFYVYIGSVSYMLGPPRKVCRKFAQVIKKKNLSKT